MVAIAVASGIEVGIDVEGLARRVSDDAAIARAHFSPEEQSFLEAIADPLDRRRAFLGLWTAKEAFIKATGHGLSLPLASFRVDLPCSRYTGVAPLPGVSGFRWMLTRWTPPAHLVALATGSPPGRGVARIDCRESHWDPDAASFRGAAVPLPPAAA